MFVAVDSNPELLARIAWQSERKPSRGGVPNLLCLAEAAEALSRELPGVADRISVILPWGRLLRSVAQPDLADLRSIAALCQPEATIEIVFSYDPCVDAQKGGPLPKLVVDEAHVVKELPRLYRLAGLDVTGVQRLPLADLKSYSTTWARRLSFGREREVWRVTAICRL